MTKYEQVICDLCGGNGSVYGPISISLTPQGTASEYAWYRCPNCGGHGTILKPFLSTASGSNSVRPLVYRIIK